MFWNFISSLPVKRGGSLSILVGTISNVLVMEIGWTDVDFKRFYETQLKLSYDIGFVYRGTDGHGETSIPPYNFVAGGINIFYFQLRSPFSLKFDHYYFTTDGLLCLLYSIHSNATITMSMVWLNFDLFVS
jgi:hypothetical protein